MQTPNRRLDAGLCGQCCATERRLGLVWRAETVIVSGLPGPFQVVVKYCTFYNVTSIATAYGSLLQSTAFYSLS
jgi:hypothetical protein